MSLSMTATSQNSAKIEVGGQTRMQFTEDGGAELHKSPTHDSPHLHIATMEALWAYGGMPRFTPYVWGGRADAMPAGDTQSSGQQLLDLMYPDMRADVVDTQFTCPENEWQADPYKRLTHWSLGDGVSWMRPPDKNCVQPGSLEGPFFAGGVSSDSPLLGAAVLDQFQGHNFGTAIGDLGDFSLNVASGGTAVGALRGESGPKAKPTNDGTNGVPRVGKITRPRTWYGIWMIRMYGRVVNTGALDAAGLNARIDVLDGRISALEGLLQSTYVYPAGGSAGTEGVVSANQVLTVPNPYPGHRVECFAELFLDGDWVWSGHETGSGNTTASYFTHANQKGDSIVVVTGTAGVSTNRTVSGTPANIATAIPSAKLRVRVKRTGLNV